MSRTKYSIIRIVGLIIVTAIISYVAYKGFRTIHGLGAVLGKMTVINDIPNEYRTLFKNDAKITYKETHFDDNKNLNPVSDLIYDDKYVIFITKIKTVGNLNSLPLITLQFRETEMTDDVPYSLVSRSDYSELEYFLDTLTATNISLTLYGDSIRSLMKNDNVEGYYLRNKVFSINYIKDGVVNLFMKATKSEYSVPTVLCFLMHQRSMYFICISVCHPDDRLNVDVIDKLMKIP